jgi:hypothetical protein
MSPVYAVYFANLGRYLAPRGEAVPHVLSAWMSFNRKEAEEFADVLGGEVVNVAALYPGQDHEEPF